MRKVLLTTILFFLFFVKLFPQDKRLQYPPGLSNSYFGISVGYINYPFSNIQLESGYIAESIRVPHTAVQIIPFGHQFNKYLSAQLSYMRPVSWIIYKNINGDKSRHSVWMNFATVSMQVKIPLGKNFFISAETGFSVVTRRRFKINNIYAVKKANYGSVSFGAGLVYSLNHKWDLLVSSNYFPENSKVKQPHSFFIAGGFRYNMRSLDEKKLKENENDKYIFPKQLLQLGFATNTFGYGVNDFFSKGFIPIFWAGDVAVKKGISFHYQRNIFHTKKMFSFDAGTSFSYWQSNETMSSNKFFTFSAFPVLRFIVIRSKPADLYFNYSVAGPTYISRVKIDNRITGKHFTFQDFMGMGVFVGKKRSLNAEVRITHYSNGNIFTDNPGITIPLNFNLGYAF